MGQFSYICKECNKPIKNNQDDVILFHIFEGKVKEKIFGTYDGYGRAGCSEFSEQWEEIVHQEFDMDENYGVAAVHVDCYREDPTTCSEHDPDQGW